MWSSIVLSFKSKGLQRSSHRAWSGCIGRGVSGMESAFVLQSMEAPLLLERGLQVAQHTELGEHDGSGVVAVERAHLPVLKMEDINARDVELLTGCREVSQTHRKVTPVGSVQRQLNDDDVTVKVEVVEFAVHIRKCSRVDVGRTSDFVALIFDSGRDVPPVAVLGEQ